MNIDRIISGALGESVPGPDREKKEPYNNIEKRGRKNRGVTSAHYNEYKEKKRRDYKDFKSVKNSNNFDLVESVRGEVVQYDDINDFKELYALTCSACLDEFKNNNADLVKKHPYNWYKPLLLNIKKSVPVITADNIDKCGAVWECLSDLLYEIGLYPTFELFSYMTNIYKYQLESRRKLSPKYSDFLKKISIESDNALISEIATNPYNQTNKIFLAKVHGIVEKTEPKTIEVNHNIRNYDSLPMFSPPFLEDQQQQNTQNS